MGVLLFSDALALADSARDRVAGQVGIRQVAVCVRVEHIGAVRKTSIDVLEVRGASVADRVSHESRGRHI